MENVANQPAHSEQKTNRFAIVGFGLTIAGIALAALGHASPIVGILDLLGLAFGIAGLKQIRKTREKGRNLALFSIVVGSIAVLGLIAAVILVALNESR